MIAGINLLGLIIMGLLFIGYLLGVWLITVMSKRLHSITFIKSMHLIIFLLVSALLAAMVYEVIVGRITYLTWITVGMFAAEGVVLIRNSWRCPLTAIAESLGSTHGQVTDIFLPKWFADRVFAVYTWLFAGALVLLVIRSLL